MERFAYGVELNMLRVPVMNDDHILVAVAGPAASAA
jgi:hypothetical protein